MNRHVGDAYAIRGDVTTVINPWSMCTCTMGKIRGLEQCNEVFEP